MNAISGRHGHGGGTKETPHTEKVRKKIVDLVFIVYWLLIFEGVLRKWVLPQMNRPLIFIRDPFVLYIYILAWRNGMWPKKTGLFTYASFLMVLGIAFTAIQFMTSPSSIISTLYGWRMWFFYIPLAFIIGEAMNDEDIRKLIRQTLYVAIPMAAIAYMQVSSPIRSFINRSVEDGVYFTESGAQGGEIIRTVGTFTFFHGYQIFLGSIIAFCFICWILPRDKRPLTGPPLIIATLCTGIAFSLDVTRLPSFLAVITAVGAVVGGMTVRDASIRRRAAILVAVLIACGLALSSVYFIKTKSKRAERFESSEYLQDRVWGMFVSTQRTLQGAPLFGYGFGVGTRGGQYLGAAGGGAENEWENNVAEGGPIIGLLYIGLRLWIFWYLVRGAISAAKRSNDPTPITLIAFTAPIIVIWYITSKSTVNGYGWILAGLCIAANRLRLR